MTTRTMPATHMERCKDLAGLEKPCQECLVAGVSMRGRREDNRCSIHGMRWWDEGIIKVVDARFASLRVKHDWRLVASSGEHPMDHIYECERCSTRCRGDLIPAMGSCVLTDGDALDEAIAACGYVQRLERRSDDSWKANLYQPAMHLGEVIERGVGKTSREAKSAALWQAVFGGSNGPA